jgi:hypothetical protein
MHAKTYIVMAALSVATVPACGSSDTGFRPTGARDAGSGGASASGGTSAGGRSATGGGSSGGKAGSAGSWGTGGSSSGGASNSDASTSTDSGAGASSIGGSDASFVDGGSLGPTVSILHPGAGVERTVNVSIYFHGTAMDPTDGALGGSALVWTDSREGQFGTGDPVNWAPTVTGSHTITLRAVDSLGYGATDSITFNIVP